VNLKEIREEINAALDYNPDLQQYKDMTSRIVNRHYQQVSSQYHWLFMQKRFELTLRADIDGSSTDTMTFSNSRKGDLPTGAGTSAVKLLPVDVEGAFFVVNNREYEITRRPDERSIVINESLNGTFTDWKIKFKRYALPRECVEVLGLVDRGITMTETLSYTDAAFPNDPYTSTQTTTAPDRGRFTFLDARKEEFLYLDRDDTGDPFVSIEEMHADVFPPDLAIVLDPMDSSGSSSNLALGDTYQYCYTYLYAGRESAPSPVSEITLSTTGHLHIALNGFINTSAKRVSGSDKDTGRLKKIYRRLDSLGSSRLGRSRTLGLGVWRHIATISESVTSYTDEGEELTTNTVLGTTSPVDIDGVLYDLNQLNEIGPRQYIRLWYTPASDYKIEGRYLMRPFRLVNEADTPNWPVQYHHLLVFLALRDICMQHGMLSHSQIYEGRASIILNQMKAKYLSRSDRMYVRRGFDRAFTDKERWGVPSKS